MNELAAAVFDPGSGQPFRGVCAVDVGARAARKDGVAAPAKH